MITRWLLWISWAYHNWRDRQIPKVGLRDEWTHETRNDR
jgi:hypothetical protein